MRIISLLLLSLSLFSYSGVSSASSSNIWRSSYAGNDYFSATPETACDLAINASIYASRTYRTYEFSPVLPSSPTRWVCKAFSSGPASSFVTFNASLVVCPADTTFNSETGICEGDPCLPTIGQKLSHTHRWGDFTGAGTVGAKIDPPPSICNTDATPNCQYSNTFNQLRPPYRHKDSNPNGVWVDLEYVGNGVSCTGTETARATPGAPGQTRDKASTCTNKVTDAEGRVSYSCLATDVNKEPGEMNCGEVNGVFKCIPAKPSPALTDKKIETEVTETTNPDGSKSTETTTTTTITNCTGANACTSTTTVNTHTSGTNSDGSPGGESSTCTGAGCSNGAGTPEETTEEPEKPDQECDPETDPDRCGESFVAGVDCSVSLDCTGDAIDCAMLRMQKDQQCSMDWDENKSSVLAEASKPEYALETEDIDSGDLFSGPTAGRWLAPICPADRVIHLATTGTTITFSWTFVCQYAEALGNLLVALSSLFFAIYVGRSFGGD